MNIATHLRPMARSTYDLLRVLALCALTGREIDSTLRALRTDRHELAALVRLLATSRGADAVVDLGRGVGVRSFAELLVDLEMLDDGQATAQRERAAMAGVIAARKRALARFVVPR